jgi:hypothetical protein
MGTAKFIRGISALDSAYDGASGQAAFAPGINAPAAGVGAPSGTGAGTGAIAGMSGAMNGGSGVGATGGVAGVMAGMGGGGSGTAAGSGSSAMAGSGAAGAVGAAGAAGAAGATSAAGEGAPSGVSAGTLKIQFATVNQNGRYAPANVGAIWIEDGAGKFVKTIKRWAGIRASHLTAWKAASGGWPSFFGGGNAADQMDAISAGTLRAHGMQDVSWDMKDLMGQLVPDGPYKVGIEVTEDNRVPGANAKIEFVKGAMPQTVMPPDKAPYAGLTISYQP